MPYCLYTLVPDGSKGSTETTHADFQNIGKLGRLTYPTLYPLALPFFLLRSKMSMVPIITFKAGICDLEVSLSQSWLALP